MKNFILLLLFSNMVFSQAFVQNNKMIVQGVARDNNNIPKKDQELSLQFSIYYYNNNSVQFIVNQQEAVETDDFGVFNYTFEIPKTSYETISKFPIYVRISEGSTNYVDEKVLTSPYAIYAQNGVPTGSIVAFHGSENDIPKGWVLCDGRSFPDDYFHKTLKDFLGGNNTPDLRGQFLRGSGNYVNDNSKAGPDLNQYQNDEFSRHRHYIDRNSNTTGEHSHQIDQTTWHEGNGGQTHLIGAKRNGANNTSYQDLNGNYSIGGHWGGYVEWQTDHRHQFDGNTQTTGGDETRPPSYGINFIIKI